MTTGGGGEQTSSTSDLLSSHLPHLQLWGPQMGLNRGKKAVVMVMVGATFQDGPQERQDAVTLATSAPLKRQVLPRCPGNSGVLRFIGK